MHGHSITVSKDMQARKRHPGDNPRSRLQDSAPDRQERLGQERQRLQDLAVDRLERRDQQHQRLRQDHQELPEQQAMREMYLGSKEKTCALS